MPPEVETLHELDVVEKYEFEQQNYKDALVQDLFLLFGGGGSSSGGSLLQSDDSTAARSSEPRRTRR